MKNFSSPAFFAVLAALIPLSQSARAQNMPDESAPNNTAVVQSGAARVVEVDENSLSGLPAILSKNGGPGAISLRASEEAFEADAAARDALLAWVRAGGTVFLHTGAARSFGFRTVTARLGSNALAGQLYGRARAALPFGAHPLLWDDGKSNRAGGAPGADPTLLPGVNVVFYELREGDDLVVSHPAGTPLLEVRDLAGDARNPLYAAALAPFGRGFAVFTPDFIDQKRGDGALFARNLLNLLSPAGKSSGAKLVGIAASVIENGGADSAPLQSALSKAGAAASAPALPAFGTTTPDLNGAAPNQNAIDAAPAMLPEAVAAPAIAETERAIPQLAQAQVLLTRAEAGSYARLLAAGGDRAGAAINLLRARLFLSRGEGEQASRSVEAAAEIAPNVAEVALWRGILLAGAAQEINQPSPVRAQLLGDAAQSLSQAARATSITAGLTNATAANGADATGAATIAGIPLTALRLWSTKMGQIAQVFALEPPLVQRYGTGSGTITVRAIAQDSSLPLIVQGAQLLANARIFGWHADNEEILLFPTPQSYAAYRRALGLNGPTIPAPAGVVGDVVGQRILMLSLPPASLLTNNTPINLLARLHSHALLRAYDESGRAPAWLQLGLENLANTTIAGNNNSVNDNRNLEQFAQAGGLLTPAQFNGNFGNRASQLVIAQAQTAAMMTYFYRAYGAGAVNETVQRIGAGQSIDEALQATTQSDQTTFFRNWRDAQFGPRNFPNAG